MKHYTINVKALCNSEGLAGVYFDRVSPEEDMVRKMFMMSGTTPYRATLYAIMASVKGIEHPCEIRLFCDDSNAITLVSLHNGIKGYISKRGDHKTLQTRMFAAMNGAKTRIEYKDMQWVRSFLKSLDRNAAIPDAQYWDVKEGKGLTTSLFDPV